VRPANFGFNAQTAANNAFQNNDTSRTIVEIEQAARQEFDDFVEKLRRRAVEVVVMNDQPNPLRTDAVFPNNWVTFHADGTIITYPMFSPNRRLEREDWILEEIKSKFIVNNQVHLEHYESIDRFLEGTGSMIFDRAHEICYACLSPRTSLELLDELCDLLHYKRMAFRSVDGKGQDIYHTNVMMAVGETFVVICLDTIQDEKERLQLLRQFDKTGKEVIEISLEQMENFAGNMLQVRNPFGETFLVMSSKAYHALSSAQVAHIERHTEILHTNISTIETYGGGSARCMMAEIFLEKRAEI
jgi:hypothetical protein